MENIVSNWTGSEFTSEFVRRQILTRWGEKEANNYDPKSNCLTFNRWIKNGYKVKKGETSLKSFIVIEQKDHYGKVIRQYPKRIHLFYSCQVEKV
jgi:hypothetical protein